MPTAVLVAFIAAAGALYLVYYLRMGFREREAIAKEPGRPALLAPLCFAIYFLLSLGFPDYVLGTVCYRKLKLVDDARLPGTLVAATVVPGALTAITFLGHGSAEFSTVLLCVAAESAGSLLGVRLVRGLNGGQIRKILGCCMVAAIAAFLLQSCLHATGSLSGLSAGKLAVALPVLFVLGALNMFGVPMKPTSLLLLLLLGMSPLGALTVCLTMGSVGPMMGGIQVLKAGNYQKKIALYAATVGLAAAFVGSRFALSIDNTVYTVVLVAIMCYAAYSLLKPDAKA